MVSKAPTLLGQYIQVPSGLRGKCDTCVMYGRPSRLVTNGTETADVVEETRFNGRFTNGTGQAAVLLECPEDGRLVQFRLGMRL